MDRIEAIAEALVTRLKLQLRDKGWANIQSWLERADNGDGDVLLLRSSVHGDRIIETGLETRTWK